MAKLKGKKGKIISIRENRSKLGPGRTHIELKDLGNINFSSKWYGIMELSY